MELTRQERTNLLSRYENKEERMLLSQILDKAYRFEKEDKLLVTHFLNLHELSLAMSALQYFSIPHTVYTPCQGCSKKMIFFLPSYLEDIGIIAPEFIAVIAIRPAAPERLQHKDYMGSLYAMGIKSEMIGDIFVSDKEAYVFCTKECVNYLVQNLFKVGNQEVRLEEYSLDSPTIQSLSVDYVPKEYIIPSFRVDAAISTVYHLGRKEAKDKIVKGELYINDKVCINPSEQITEEDIISLKRCGKLKVGETLRHTKSGNVVIMIYHYA